MNPLEAHKISFETHVTYEMVPLHDRLITYGIYTLVGDPMRILGTPITNLSLASKSLFISANSLIQWPNWSIELKVCIVGTQTLLSMKWTLHNVFSKDVVLTKVLAKVMFGNPCHVPTMFRP